MVEKVSENIYLVDTLFSNRRGDTSVFLLRDDRTVILDSGVSVTAENIIRGIKEAGISPEEVAHIALSHAHYDHAGGAHVLLRLLREMGNDRVKVACAKQPSVYLSRHDILQKLIEFGRASYGEFAGVMEPIAEEDFLILEDGDVMDLGAFSIRAIDTPGHAKGHMVFHVPDLDFIFVGDACGIMGRDKAGTPVIVPTSFPPEYSYDIYIDTIRRIATMGVSRIGFAHFGVLEDPVPALEKAVETAGFFRRLTADMVAGKRSKADLIDQLEDTFGEAMFSLSYDHESLRTLLNALVQGNVVDLTRL
jgi:glyoxylase-like metal-dependent hydrolase (beta-lactamase superfamily II)